MTSPNQWSSGRPDPGWGDMQGMAKEFIEEFFDNWLNNNFTSTDTFHDFQRDLNKEINYLKNVSGYCNLVMSKDWSLTGGGNSATPIPFDDHLGQYKNASPYKGKFTPSNKERYGILLEAEGTWQADARVTTGPGNSVVNAELYLSLWDLKTRSLASEGFLATATTSGGMWRSNTVMQSFIVPEADRYVVCCSIAHGALWWPVKGGDRYSRLSVSRWDVDGKGRMGGTGEPQSGGNYD
jgi:hypothetical protein